MNEALEISYPIFLKEKGAIYISKFENFDELVGDIEPWFVEDNLTEAIWDRKGRRYILLIKDKKTEEFEILKDSRDADPEGLIQVLMKHSEEVRQKYPFTLDEPCKDPVELFDKIERHEEYYRWSKRVKRKIMSWFRKQSE